MSVKIFVPPWILFFLKAAEIRIEGKGEGRDSCGRCQTASTQGTAASGFKHPRSCMFSAHLCQQWDIFAFRFWSVWLSIPLCFLDEDDRYIHAFSLFQAWFAEISFKEPTLDIWRPVVTVLYLRGFRVIQHGDWQWGGKVGGPLAKTFPCCLEI